LGYPAAAPDIIALSAKGGGRYNQLNRDDWDGVREILSPED